MRNIDKIKDVKKLDNHGLLSFIFSCQIETEILEKLKKPFQTFRELFFALPERLKHIEKIDDKTIALLQCIREIIERSAREKLKELSIIKSPDDVLEYCKTTMSTLATEQVRILFLNNNNMLMFDAVEDYGCVNSVAIYVRNIVKQALNLEATAIIIIHNHPGRKSNPSIDDFSSTKQLAEATKKVDVQLLDHIIISGDNYFSMRELNIL
jgi:DNA repair protein RadC